MITQQELTDKCIPEIIKKMVELAEGFEINGLHVVHKFSKTDKVKFHINTVHIGFLFPLLIHRVVEGWLKLHPESFIEIHNKEIQIVYIGHGHTFYLFKDYQPTTLTACECALLDCLVDVLSKEGI